MTSNPAIKEVKLSNRILVELMSGVHDKGAVFKFKASGYSMYPIIHSGDVIKVSPFSIKNAVPGFIAVFINPRSEKLIVHRIIKKRKDRYLCRGDNSIKLDGWVPVNRMIGYVSGIERNGKIRFCPYGKKTTTKLFFPFTRTWLKIRRIMKAIKRKIDRDT